MKIWSREWRLERLRDLCGSWEDCTKCGLGEGRKNTVFGNGDPCADIMMIGEGPGETEDETGEPFSGESGRLLDDLLGGAGIAREGVFVTNLVMCRPSANRVPTRKEREACYPRLNEQIYLVDPLLIIPVGKTAMTSLMGGEWKSIEGRHGQIGEVRIRGRYTEVSYPAMPIFHPAFILRDDRINPETNTWKELGPAHRTLRDLVMARDIVEVLKKSYSKMPKKLRGHPALQVKR